MIKAKKTSLVGQIFASVWIVGWSTYKFIQGDSIEIGDVVYSGLAIAGCFTPVYFSILLDKLKEIKLGI